MKISKTLAIALLTDSARTIKVGNVNHRDEYVQSSVVKAELATQLAQLEPGLDSRDYAQIMSLPKTFDDYYVAVSDESACPWSVTPGTDKGTPWNSWMKVEGGVCKVIKKPELPWPATAKTWSQKNDWKKANPGEWTDYKTAMKNASKNAEYYLPYEEAKCAAVGGKKSQYAIVPRKMAKLQKYCPKKYPGEESEDEDKDKDDGSDDKDKDDGSDDKDKDDGSDDKDKDDGSDDKDKDDGSDDKDKDDGSDDKDKDDGSDDKDKDNGDDDKDDTDLGLKRSVGGYYQTWSATCTWGSDPTCDLSNVSPYVDQVFIAFSHPAKTAFDTTDANCLGTMFPDTRPDTLKASIKKLRAKNPNVKLYLSVGGATFKFPNPMPAANI